MALGSGFPTNLNRFGILSFCTLAVLCLIGLCAATAHAEAQWRIRGVPLEGEEKEGVTIVGNTSQSIEVSSLNFELHCTGVSLDSGIISDKPGGDFQGILLYTSCTAAQKSTGKEVPSCNPLEGKITATVLGLLIEHNSKTYLLLRPLTGKPLATIKLSELCALAETSELTGSMVAECVPVANCEEEKTTHSLKINEAGLFSIDKLKFGENKAVYKGEITLELNGENIGQEWQGVAQAPPTKLCKAVPPENAVTHRLKCPAGEGYSGEIRGEISAGNGSLLSTTEAGKEITCAEVKYDGKFQENGAPAAAMGGINNLTYTAAGGGACTSTLAGGSTVTVAFLNLPYSNSVLVYRGLGNPQGVLGFRPQAANMPVRLKLVITAGMVTCEYHLNPPSMVGTVFNGVGANPTALIMAGFWMRDVNGGGCPEKLQQSAALTLKRPNPVVGQPDLNVYVASE